MGLTSGCMQPHEDHGKAGYLTIEDFEASATLDNYARASPKGEASKNVVEEVAGVHQLFNEPFMLDGSGFRPDGIARYQPTFLTTRPMRRRSSVTRICRCIDRR